jgi:outer membrane receptor for ferrienterochelin and colicins
MIKKTSMLVCSMIAMVAYANNIELNTITVSSSNDKIQNKERLLKNSVAKTAIINRKGIIKTQSQTLTQAISKQVGVDVMTGCSLCGLKRVELNGLRGNYTTVLVDGIPFNSTVSSFYGLDSISTATIQQIDITRGAGASLTAPEAIGGTINIIPRRPSKDAVEVDGSMGTLGERSFSLVGQQLSKDKKTGILISASYFKQAQVDRDHNGVSESPSMKNSSATVLLTHRFSPYDSILIRGAHYESNVLGGAMVSYDDAVSQMINNPTNTQDQSNGFVGGNVNNNYVGQPLLNMEKIDTTRDEIYLKERHSLTNTIGLKTTLAYSQQHQASMYEGNDYANMDKTYYVDFKSNYAINDNHFLTYGVDTKVETLRSESYAYYVKLGRPSDDFDYRASGLYAQDDWTIDTDNELIIALRAENISANWLAHAGNKIDKTLLVPRLLYRHYHTPALVSRLSAGMGYRAPLTFFESDHGVLDNGFGIDITKLERSTGVNYSLSYNKNALAVTGSLAYTQIKNLAYIDNSSGISILKNADNTLSVKNADIDLKYTLDEHWTLGGNYAINDYGKNYKSYMTLPAIEETAHLNLDYDAKGWDIFTDATWVGARNIAPYGFENSYNDTAQSSLKSTKVPSFVTVDMKISKTFDKNYTLYVGAKNLFDYVQTDHESPLYYDAQGNFNTTFIWGPLRGRMLYAGLKAKF